MLKFTRFSFLFLIALLSTSFALKAQHYSLDTNFASKGIDSFKGYNPSGYIHRPVLVLPQIDNKKIVIVGNVWLNRSLEVMRLNYDGSLDNTFNDSGKAVFVNSGVLSPPIAAILYDTSKILTASDYITSTGYEYAAVFNINSNGTLNTSFGTGGMVVVGLSGAPVYSFPTDLGAQTDGKFIMLGSTLDHATGFYEYVLTRLLPNGTVDATYGTAGLESDPYPVLNTAQPGGVLAAMPACGYMQADNKYIVVSRTQDSIAKYNGYMIAVTRHNVNGSPDLTFGEAAGMTIIKDSAVDYEPGKMAVDSAGNIYVYATYGNPSPPFHDTSLVVVKLDPNGHRVTGYGHNGVTYLRLIKVFVSNNGFAVQRDGRVILPGVYRSSPPFEDKSIVYRLDQNGNIDTSFNTGGYVVVQIDSDRGDLCTTGAVQPDGKILLAGYDTFGVASFCMRLTNYNNTRLAVPGVHPGRGADFSSSVFPNPAHDRNLRIHYTNNQGAGSARVQLYDISGRIIGSCERMLLHGEGDILYSLPETGEGMYYIVVQTDSGIRQVHPLTVIR